jgi:hypothetical protein
MVNTYQARRPGQDATLRLHVIEASNKGRHAPHPKLVERAQLHPRTAHTVGCVEIESSEQPLLPHLTYEGKDRGRRSTSSDEVSQ